MKSAAGIVPTGSKYGYGAEVLIPRPSAYSSDPMIPFVDCPNASEYPTSTHSTETTPIMRKLRSIVLSTFFRWTMPP